jgi:alkanesulfonate monooxygenase SsuD/methylene tetrahydromethanopterin reductase-like flavin-dependent oxidoreductase (luciferase family)
MLKIGVFDHMDRSHGPLALQYDERLQLIEAYDRAAFHAYHLAEHHANPVGLAPSPSVFLAAVAQRTKRLRFGPLVYTLALYHPVRLLEEICMLDQMSNGRLEFGVGRGVSPIEQTYYGNDPTKAQAIYAEVLDIVLRGLTSETLTYHGKFFTFRDVPVELEPVQKPHPPLWYGVSKPESTEWTARHKVNIVCFGTADRVRRLTDKYRAEWATAGFDPREVPLMGMSRHIVIAESDDIAVQAARRAYEKWYQSLMTLWRKHGLHSENVNFPDNFDKAERMGLAFAGSAARVRSALFSEITKSGINYLLFRAAFGDLTLTEAMRSVELFTTEVMPVLVSL